MIKKLDIKNYENKQQLIWFGVINKLNELVDAVNGILDYAPLEMAMKAEPEPADPYAEQRKWIGKLCKFWDKNHEEDRIYDILHHIDPNCVYKYCRRELGGGYQYCEPVKPDDDIIYKGV